MVMERASRIMELESRVDRLPADVRQMFNRIYHVRTSVGHLNPPQSMYGWIQNYFGSIDAVRNQRIVRVTNTVTWDGALFNALRARRPIEARSSKGVLDKVMEKVGDPFCDPLESTPEDAFGRVEGEHCITASNAAKYDALHGIVIYNRHNPFIFTEEDVIDYVNTALQWAEEAHAYEPAAKYFFFMWNCLWKAGASIIHGHSQVTLTQDMHYAKIEELRRDSLRYTQQHDSNYFDDLCRVHEALDLGLRWRDVRIFACLTPAKERETWLVADELNDDLKLALYRVLQTFLVRFHVNSFNVALAMPPIAEVDEDWNQFPTIFRVVDRGDPMSRTTDIGAMELYAATVIGTDPFFVADELRDVFSVAGDGG